MSTEYNATPTAGNGNAGKKNDETGKVTCDLELKRMNLIEGSSEGTVLWTG